MDVEAIKVIARFEGSKLQNNPWSYVQISRATALGLGVKSDAEYFVVTSLNGVL